IFARVLALRPGSAELPCHGVHNVDHRERALDRALRRIRCHDREAAPTDGDGADAGARAEAREFEPRREAGHEARIAARAAEEPWREARMAARPRRPPWPHDEPEVRNRMRKRRGRDEEVSAVRGGGGEFR